MESAKLQRILRCTPRPLFFGGSFNPFHRGHKAIVAALHWYFPNYPIILLPNRISPFKHQNISTMEKITLMQAVLQDLQAELPNANLHLEFCELLREGPSYTADTLHYLSEKKSKSFGSFALPCIWVIGWDSLSNLHQWKDWNYLTAKCIFLVFRRQSLKKAQVEPEIMAKINYILLELDEPYSSSEIRQLLAKRLPPEINQEIPSKIEGRTEWPADWKNEDSETLKLEYLKNLLGTRQLAYIQQQGLYLQTEEGKMG